MSFNKKFVALIAVLILQLVFFIALNRFFVNDMREDIAMMRQELIEKGMPNEQASEISSAMRSTVIGISSYVLQTTIFFVVINSVLVIQLVKKQNHEKENADK